MKLIFSLIVVLCGSFSSGLDNNYKLEEVYYWTHVSYENLPYDVNTYIGNYPYYIPENNDVLSASYHAQSGLMLSAVPRFRPGVPSTLNAFCVSNYPTGSSPRLWGFPDYNKNTLKPNFYGSPHDDNNWKTNTTTKTYSSGYFNYFHSSQPYGGVVNIPSSSVHRPYDFSIISTYHVKVDDRCNRAFIIDTGVLHYSSSVIYDVQRPAIVVFDLPADGCVTRQFPVVRRVDIPDHLWTNPVGFVYVTLDYQDKYSCDDVLLYITNVFDSSLIVYNYKTGDFWTLSAPPMYPIYAESTMIYKDFFTYTLPMGITNVALGHPDVEGNKIAYFAPGTGSVQYAVSTKVFKNAKSYPYNYNPGDFSLIGYRGCNSQHRLQLLDLTTNVMFYADGPSGKIRCWNPAYALSPDTMGIVFETNCFISDMNIDSSGYLWFHCSNMPFIYLSDAPLNLTEVNSKTYRVKVTEAIRGTVCDTLQVYSPHEIYY
ncbi:Six-bladed beta-propeller, TolB-like [Sergentomyia squamirostris]